MEEEINKEYFCFEEMKTLIEKNLNKYFENLAE